jgi:hypothetical protein
VQICYWVTKPFAGYGIATEVTDILVERAFLGYRYNYVELHIDEQNTASKRIPEKLGFSVQDTYEQKMGKKGSGKMQLWVKENPYPVFRTQVFVEKKGLLDLVGHNHLDFNMKVVAPFNSSSMALSKTSKGYICLSGFFLLDKSF